MAARLLELTAAQREALGETGTRSLETRSPRYECAWCEKRGDMRTDPTTVKLVVVARDPDLHEAGVIWMDLHHARCRPAELAFTERVMSDLPASPAEVGLAINVNGEEHHTEFRVDVVPLLFAEDEDVEELVEPEAALLLDAHCTDDGGRHQAWAFAWGNHFREEGFERWSDGPGNAEGWSVRITADREPQWLAIRRAPIPDQGPPDHFWMGQVPLPEAWVQRARELGRVLLLTGPVGPRWELAGHELEDVREDVADGALMAAVVPLEELVRPTPAAAGVEADR
jgi:hypothetical protein